MTEEMLQDGYDVIDLRPVIAKLRKVRDLRRRANDHASDARLAIEAIGGLEMLPHEIYRAMRLELEAVDQYGAADELRRMFWDEEKRRTEAAVSQPVARLRFLSWQRVPKVESKE